MTPLMKFTEEDFERSLDLFRRLTLWLNDLLRKEDPHPMSPESLDRIDKGLEPGNPNYIQTHIEFLALPSNGSLKIFITNSSNQEFIRRIEVFSSPEFIQVFALNRNFSWDPVNQSHEYSEFGTEDFDGLCAYIEDFISRRHLPDSWF